MVNPSAHSSDSRAHDSVPKNALATAVRPDPTAPEISFPRRKVQPIKPAKSALTAMLAATSSSSNPFTEFYAAISGRAETDSSSVAVFFPRAKKPSGKVMDLNVRKDASVEEVLGYALWNYWEEGWLPTLDEGLKGEDDPRATTVLSAVGWVLRIAEDDGEVDEDYPREPFLSLHMRALDNSEQHRIGLVEYPSIALTRMQFWRLTQLKVNIFVIQRAHMLIHCCLVQQNNILESKIQRRPSRVMGKKKKIDGALLSAGITPQPGLASALGLSLGMSPGFSVFNPGSFVNPGPQMFLRIRVAESADAVHVSTTIPV